MICPTIDDLPILLVMVGFSIGSIVEQITRFLKVNKKI